MYNSKSNCNIAVLTISGNNKVKQNISKMEIKQEEITRRDWTNQLKNMPSGNFAGYEDKIHYGSMRLAATRLQKNNNWKFHFDRSGERMKITKELIEFTTEKNLK